MPGLVSWIVPERPMMKKSRLLMVAVMTAALAGVAGGSLLPVSVAVAADKDKTPKPKMTPAVQKPLAAAQKALQEKNYDEALAKLQEAKAVESRNAYDEFMVDELGWYIHLQRKDYVESAAALERALATGFVPEADQAQRRRALAQLNLQNKDYAKAIRFGEEYLQSNPQDGELALAVAQAKYLSDDFAGAKASVERIVASNAKPAEPALLLALRANYELKDDAGVMSALENLVRYYPEQKYWEDLLNNQLFRTKDDRGLRGLYRLIHDTNTLDRGEEYAEMGSTLINAGFPNEAMQVLERGMSANAYEGGDKARAQADLERARSGAALDAKELPNAGAQLASAKNGNQMVGIGKLYFSSGEYEKAADALSRGLERGGVTDADDAQLLLGIAYSRLGNAEAAKAAFDKVANPAINDIARLWKLHLESRVGTGSVALTD